MIVKANAKLNLYLKIIGKRVDNYHLLNMINVPIDIYDEMTIEISPFKSLQLKQGYSTKLDCSIEKTTIYKAFQVVKGFLPDNIIIDVYVTKNIPQGSGMGGGSSDAAFFIKRLSEYFDFSLTHSLICEISTKVGADVPFFLYNKPAFLEGIGESVFPYEQFPEMKFLVVVPDFSISTKWAYEQIKIDLTKINDNINIKNLKLSFDQIINYMANDLQDVVLEKYTAVQKIIDFLERNGAVRAMMTGSGSAVFGIFKDNSCLDAAELAAKENLKQYKVLKCKTIGV